MPTGAPDRVTVTELGVGEDTSFELAVPRSTSAKPSGRVTVGVRAGLIVARGGGNLFRAVGTRPTAHTGIDTTFQRDVQFTGVPLRHVPGAPGKVLPRPCVALPTLRLNGGPARTCHGRGASARLEPAGHVGLVFQAGQRAGPGRDSGRER